MKKRILLCDLSSILHSVKYSLAKHRLSNNEKSTFVIYGFLLKLQFLIRKTKAEVIVYALDSQSSLRKNIYSRYKENRNKNKDEKQEELDRLALPQFAEVIEYVIPELGYRNRFKAEGLEADDVIASVCKKYKNDEIIICSTDQDLYQLLTPNVCILNAKTNNWYTISKFEVDYGIEPKMWKRVKAIGGCTSDNVGGIPIPQDDPNKKQMHVKEKTALNFIKGELGENTKAYKAIVSKEGKKIMNRNKRLVILPFRGTPEFNIMPDRPRELGLVNICEKYGFKSIESTWEKWRKSLRLR